MVIPIEDYNLYLSESSDFAPAKLKNIEFVFERLKRTEFNDINLRKKLLNLIKDFTKIREIIIIYENKGYNAGIIPVYKADAVKDVGSHLVNIIGGKSFKDESISPKALAHLKFIRDPVRAIKTVYLMLGIPLLKNISGGEFVALLLHELGHVYSVTSNLPYQFLIKMRDIFSITNKYHILVFLISLIYKLFFLYTVVVFGLIYGVTLINRRSETAADRYATMYGYGDELISLLSKFKGNEKYHSIASNNLTLSRLMTNIKNIFRFIIKPTDHPMDQKRINDIEDLIFNEYKNLYPSYNALIELVKNDYNNEKKKL